MNHPAPIFRPPFSAIFVWIFVFAALTALTPEELDQVNECQKYLALFPDLNKYYCYPHPEMRESANPTWKTFFLNENRAEEKKHKRLNIRVRPAPNPETVQKFTFGAENLKYYQGHEVLDLIDYKTVDNEFVDVLEGYLSNSFSESFSGLVIPSVLLNDQVWARYRALIESVDRIHDSGYVIGDLRLSNFVQNTNGDMKLASMENLVAVGTPLTEMGDPQYWEPAMFAADTKPAVFDQSGDAYRLGVAIFKLAVGTYPFPGGSKEEVQKSLEKGEYEFPANFPLGVAFLISELLLQDRQKRLQLNDAKHYVEIASSQPKMVPLKEKTKATLKDGLPEDLTLELRKEKVQFTGSASDLKEFNRNGGSAGGVLGKYLEGSTTTYLLVAGGVLLVVVVLVVILIKVFSGKSDGQPGAADSEAADHTATQPLEINVDTNSGPVK